MTNFAFLPTPALPSSSFTPSTSSRLSPTSRPSRATAPTSPVAGEMSRFARVSIPNYTPGFEPIPAPAPAAPKPAVADPGAMSAYARVDSTRRDFTQAAAAKEEAATAALAAEQEVKSKVWMRSVQAALEKVAPTRVKVFFSRTKGFAAPVYSPPVKGAKVKSQRPQADDYMATTIVRQYKAMAAPTGVFGVQCAEGTIAGQADERRVMALGAKYRQEGMSNSHRFGAYFENRKRAVIAANGCSYEESLITKFPKSTAAYILGQAEANRTCSRYASSPSAEETYMKSSVDRQMKMRACNGVYSMACTEGTYKGQAELARVMGLSTEFRMNQTSQLEKERAKFESKKYALAQYSNGCSYEEELFVTYPAAAASMRPSSYGY